MITGGYLAFGVGVPSDHHLLWIDVLGAGLGLDAVDCQPKTSAQCLKCGDPCVVLKYLTELQTQSQACNWQSWAENLCAGIHGDQLTRAQMQEYEQIDQEVTVGCLQAKHSCQKLKMGQVPWSLTLTKAINCMLYWK